MTNQEYKETQKRLTLMQISNWRSAIAQLKQFKPLEDKDYQIIYRKDNQKKERNETFEKVQYVEETYSFVFNDGYLVLKDVDIIDIHISDKVNPDDYMFDPLI